MTGGGYRVSVRLQSRHDRGSNSNMFAAKKYRPLRCVSCLQGTRMNGNNSSGENAAYFMRHSLGMKRQANYASHYFVNDVDGQFVSLLKIGSAGLIIGLSWKWLAQPISLCNRQTGIETDTWKQGVGLTGLITGEQVCQCLPTHCLCQNKQPWTSEGWAWKATSDWTHFMELYLWDGLGPTQHSHLCFVGAQHKNTIVCESHYYCSLCATSEYDLVQQLLWQFV